MTRTRLSMSDYDRAIAAAARAYVTAKERNDLSRDDVSREVKEAAYEKLAWLVDAAERGRNPHSYRPETKP
jgi:hypothetical protein